MDESRYAYHMDEPVASPPRRVVSLAPGVTESLFELNLAGPLIAVTAQCVYPEEGTARLAKIGDATSPNIHEIVELGPDLVIANTDENRREDIEALQDAGLTVWVTSPKTVRDVFNMLWNLMHVFDEPSMVERVRSIEWVADWLERMSAARDTPCRVFAATAYDPLMTFNDDTYAGDLLRVCGGANVFAGREARYFEVTLDEVVAAQPDVVLLPDAPADIAGAQLRRFSTLDIPAARNGRVSLVDHTWLTWHGTRVARVLSSLPDLLCPQETISL